MLETVHYYRESENFRAWIEASGDGGIRVFRRMKFKDLIIVFRDILPKLNKGRPIRRISRSTFPGH